MKNIIALILMVFISSCSSDDNNNELAINSQNLLGKWYIKGGTFGDEPFEYYDHECSTKKDFQEFFENNELTFNGYNSDCEIADTDISLWNLNGNILTISNIDLDPMEYEYEFIVQRLTSEELVLKQTLSEPEGTFDIEITLTRN